MIFNRNCIEKYNSPFPHIISKDAIDSFSKLNQSFPDENLFTSKIRMDKELTYPDENYINLMNTSSSWMELHKYIYSKAFVVDFLDLFKKEILDLYHDGKLIHNPFEVTIKPDPYEINHIFSLDENGNELFIYPRLDIGLGKKNYGQNNGGGGIHVDNFGRIISFLLYFDSSTDMIGGEHRMYEVKGKTLIQNKIIKSEPNLLLGSLQTNTAFHDVNPVKYIKSSRRALYFSISCSQAIWRPDEKWIMRLTKSRFNYSVLDKILIKIKKLIG